MKSLAPILLALAALVGWLLFSGCQGYTTKGSLSYSGQYGDYSVGSDGKSIIYDVKLKDPRGYAK